VGWVFDRAAGNGGTFSRQPTYAWRNIRNSANVPITLANHGSGVTPSQYYQADFDFFNETTTSIGTIGVGVGLLSARPGGCSTEWSAYWATDQGDWNTEDSTLHATHQGSTHTQGEDGKMSICEGGSWVDRYLTKSGGQPYGYPHILRGSADVTNPVVTITAPTSSATYMTTTTPLTSLAGTCTDNVACTTVTWVNDRGGSGLAQGAASWSVPSIGLNEGANVITVTASDAAGRTHQDVLTVTYTQGVPPDPTGRPRTPTGLRIRNVIDKPGSAVVVAAERREQDRREQHQRGRFWHGRDHQGADAGRVRAEVIWRFVHLPRDGGKVAVAVEAGLDPHLVPGIDPALLCQSIGNEECETAVVAEIGGGAGQQGDRTWVGPQQVGRCERPGVEDNAVDFFGERVDRGGSRRRARGQQQDGGGNQGRHARIVMPRARQIKAVA
jgi:hypothetical protein